MTMPSNPALIVVAWAWSMLLSIAAVASAADQPLPTAQAALAGWARVLDRFVNERGEVDFEALLRDRADLDLYVRYVGETKLETLRDGAERFAHLINAYNALSMFNVLESGVPATHAGLNKLAFFVFRRMDIGGRRMSLRGLENDVIRPYARSRNEPRIHFALNCMARSCPLLPRSPFTADALDAELERETRAFFARPENFRVDAARGTVWLSELLDRYREDFVPYAAASVLEYANRYAAQPAPLTFKVRFTPYDWTIANSRRPQ